MNIAKFLRPPFFIEHLWWLLLQISRREVISDFSYPFKPFSICSMLNFAMAEWFCHVNMSLQSDTVFSRTNMIFLS